jgi:FAD/FMN-containing dehydrogenase
LEKAEELAGEILRMSIRLGGSITGEHGVGLEKRAYLPVSAPVPLADVNGWVDLPGAFRRYAAIKFS